MNARLQSLIRDAETRLAMPDQIRLAEIVEAFVTTYEGPAPFTPEERAHLALIDAESFDPADPVAVAATFGWRG
ncbi:MAG: hypothetical protein NTX73_08450 [Rhodobacterales bacterium]|nr:hypothetical protein [Rhodobacterales bacterium]